MSPQRENIVTSILPWAAERWVGGSVVTVGRPLRLVTPATPVGRDAEENDKGYGKAGEQDEIEPIRAGLGAGQRATGVHRR